MIVLHKHIPWVKTKDSLTPLPLLHFSHEPSLSLSMSVPPSSDHASHLGESDIEHLSKSVHSIKIKRLVQLSNIEEALDAKVLEKNSAELSLNKGNRGMQNQW